MARVKSAALTAVLFCVATISGGVLAQAEMPVGQFVCHVELPDGTTEFAGVQAADLEAAQRILEGRSRWSVPAGWKLIECIDPASEDFSSATASRAYAEDVR